MSNENSPSLLHSDDKPLEDGAAILGPERAPQAVIKPRPIDGKYLYQRHDPRIENKDQGGSDHLHWTVQAFSWADPDSGIFFDAVPVSVEATDEASAIARAQRIIDRPGYRILNVGETCSLDESLARR